VTMLHDAVCNKRLLIDLVGKRARALRFADGNGLHERRGAAIHLLDGVLAIACIEVTPHYFIPRR